MGKAIRPAVVGLIVYLMLSLPAAMAIEQAAIVTPTPPALARQTIADLRRRCDEHCRAAGMTALRSPSLWDGRFSLLTACHLASGEPQPKSEPSS